MHNTKICSIFASSINKKKMKQNRDITMDVTSKEEELIKAIRNYIASYPNGYPQLLEYAERLFDEMTDPFNED